MVLLAMLFLMNLFSAMMTFPSHLSEESDPDQRVWNPLFYH